MTGKITEDNKACTQKARIEARGQLVLVLPDALVPSCSDIVHKDELPHSDEFDHTPGNLDALPDRMTHASDLATHPSPRKVSKCERPTASGISTHIFKASFTHSSPFYSHLRAHHPPAASQPSQVLLAALTAPAATAHDKPCPKAPPWAHTPDPPSQPRHFFSAFLHSPLRLPSSRST